MTDNLQASGSRGATHSGARDRVSDALAGMEGRMADAIRAFDWAATPLGPLSDWPVSLRTSVRFMLGQGHAICLFWGPELTLLYNDSYAPMLGAREGNALGQPFREVWPDVWDDVQPFICTALSGKGTFSTEMPLTMTRNGYPEQTWWTFSYSPVHDDEGRVAGIMNVTVDATPMVLTRQKQEVMQRELVHRIKNTLAVTSAVVTSSLRTAQSIDQARSSIASRIAALSEVQSHFNSHDGAEVSAIVASAMRPHLDCENRMIARGPRVALNPEQTVGLSLALYELATNATKYGALSWDTGRVEIIWDIDPSGRFDFQWKEHGGPTVVPPSRKGFGSRLTNTIVAAYFAGEGATFYENDGILYSLKGQLSV